MGLNALTAPPALNPASKTPLPAWFPTDPASISCLLANTHANMNANSPNKKPFDQLCGFYSIRYGTAGTSTSTTTTNSQGISTQIITTPISQCVYHNGSSSCKFAFNQIHTYITKGSGIATQILSTTITPVSDVSLLNANYDIPCNDPCFQGMNLPDDFFTGNGFPDGFYAKGGNLWEKGTDPAGKPYVKNWGPTNYADGYYPPPPPPILLNITITSPVTSIPVASTAQLTVTAHYSDGSTQDVTTSTTWTYDAPNIIVVDSIGTITGLNPGSVMATASYNGFTTTVTINVTPDTPSTVIITPSNASVAQGETQQFIATAIYADGRSLDVTTEPNITWTAGDISKATIDNTGLARGKSPGQSFIWCDYKNVQSSSAAMLNVGPPITTITITPNPAYLNNWGDRILFKATAIYSDPAIPPLDMTNGMAWSCDTYGIVKSWTLPNMFELQTYNNGTTTVYATTIVADRYSGQFLTASATLIYGDANKNPCGLTYKEYSQTASPWGSLIYDTYAPNTIAAKGCLLTCYAMVFATKGLKINGKLVDPENLNQWLNDNNGYYSGGILDTYTGSVTNFSGVSSSTLDTDKLPDLDAALTNCRAAIVGVKSYVTGKQHYVLVVRKNGGDYDIIDPMGYRSTKLSDYIITNTYSQKINQVISF